MSGCFKSVDKFSGSIKVMDFFNSFFRFPGWTLLWRYKLAGHNGFICQNIKGKFSHAYSSFQPKMEVVFRAWYILVLRMMILCCRHVPFYDVSVCLSRKYQYHTQCFDTLNGVTFLHQGLHSQGLTFPVF
jgi:hypothetical protein